MKRIIYTGTEEDIKEIMKSLAVNSNSIRKEGDSIIVFTKEESRLINPGQSIVINNGKLM